MSNADLEIIRTLVDRFSKIRQHGSAVFWADKAVCLSEGAINDVIALAESMFHCGQYHRVIAVLSRQEMFKEEIYVRFLIAQCYYKCDEYIEALKVVENIDFFQQTCENMTSNSFVSFHPQDGPLNLYDKLDRPFDYNNLKAYESNYLPPGISATMLNSSIALLKGNIYEAVNNLSSASYWYKEAFRLDPFCYEAFENMTKLEVFSAEDEKMLAHSEASSTPSMNTILHLLYMDKLPKSPSETSKLPPELSKFKNNSYILINEAERLLNINHYRRCFSLTSQVLKGDPFHPTCLPIHISVLRMVNKSNDLFLLANRLVKINPDSATSWFAIGSYYLSTRKNDLAKRHLRKATQQDRRFGPAWLALGHAYAADNEHDQSIAAYCTAAQIVRCSHIPMIYIGIEYSASSNHALAERFLHYAKQRNPTDPCVLHELGTLAFKSKRYKEALEFFNVAYTSVCNLSDQVIAPFWEPLLNNMGHTYRELGQFEEALNMHFGALNLIENSPSTLDSIGLIYAMTNRFDEAIRAFQTAISLHVCRGDTTFPLEMLKLCMKQYVNGLQPNQFSLDNKQLQPPPGRDITDSPPKLLFPSLRQQKQSTSTIPSIQEDFDLHFHKVKETVKLPDPCDSSDNDVSMDMN